MVNFKASSHAGAHKRAQAGGADEAIRKVDKLKIDKAQPADAAGPLALTVTSAGIEIDSRPSKSCLVSPAAYARLAVAAAAGGSVQGGPIYVRRPGSDVVLTARASEQVADGLICLTEVQCRNLRVCAHELYTWEPFEATQGALGALLFEAWLLNPADSKIGEPGTLCVDGYALSAQLRRDLFGNILSDAELVQIKLRGQPNERANGLQLVLRVTGVLADVSSQDIEAAGSSEQAATGDAEIIVQQHVWRGLIGAETQILVCRLDTPSSSAALDGHRQPSANFELIGGPEVRNKMVALRAKPRKGEVHVLCSDGECFPVHATLLKPCISLNRSVREALGAKKETREKGAKKATFEKVDETAKSDGASSPSSEAGGVGVVGSDVDEAVGDEAPPKVAVDVDTLSLDKVLLHLEAGLRGQVAPLDIATAEQLRPVSAKLGYRALTEHCDQVLGDFKSRLRVYSWAEVMAHNTRGGCWLAMDGMVLDVERWLPEHPGGETIIPQQARFADSTVWFELYHASRESFTYIKEFYVGEIQREDLRGVPMATDALGFGSEAGKASAEFMEQLRGFCDHFRIGNSAAAQRDAAPVPVYKSF